MLIIRKFFITGLLLTIIISCTKDAKKFKGTYNYILSKSINCTLPDTNYTENVNYIIEISQKSSESIVIGNINDQDKSVEALVNGDQLAIDSDSFGGDSFVKIKGSGTITGNNIELEYTVTTPDCIITGEGVATK